MDGQIAYGTRSRSQVTTLFAYASWVISPNAGIGYDLLAPLIADFDRTGSLPSLSTLSKKSTIRQRDGTRSYCQGCCCSNYHPYSHSTHCWNCTESSQTITCIIILRTNPDNIHHFPYFLFKIINPFSSFSMVLYAALNLIVCAFFRFCFSTRFIYVFSDGRFL